MIRKANPNDSEIITRIHTNSWKTTYNEFFPEEVFENQEKNFEQRNDKIKEAIINANEYHYIVYEEDNSIIAFACYGNGRGINYENIGEVYSIYIEQENQRKGIGSKLIKECFNILKKEGYKKAIVRCLEGNPSENFYKSLGGKVVDKENGTVGGVAIVENIYMFDI